MSFEFDCPSTFYDLTSPVLCQDDVNDGWWKTEHNSNTTTTATAPITSTAFLSSSSSSSSSPPLTLAANQEQETILAPQKESTKNASTMKKSVIESQSQSQSENPFKSILSSKPFRETSQQQQQPQPQQQPSRKSVGKVVATTKTATTVPIRKATTTTTTTTTTHMKTTLVPQSKLTLSIQKSPLKRPLSAVTTVEVAKTTAVLEATATTSDVVQLLKQHNKKFQAAPAYEPPRHSVRDVRLWEQRHDKQWAKLTPSQREVANEEIAQMKRK